MTHAVRMEWSTGRPFLLCSTGKPWPLCSIALRPSILLSSCTLQPAPLPPAGTGVALPMWPAPDAYKSSGDSSTCMCKTKRLLWSRLSPRSMVRSARRVMIREVVEILHNIKKVPRCARTCLSHLSSKFLMTSRAAGPSILQWMSCHASRGAVSRLPGAELLHQSPWNSVLRLLSTGCAAVSYRPAHKPNHT